MTKMNLAFLKWGAVALLIVVAIVLNVRRWSPKESETADVEVPAEGEPASEDSTPRLADPADQTSTERPSDADRSERPRGKVTRTRPQGTVTRTPPSPPEVTEPPVAVTDAGLPEDNLRGVTFRASERGTSWKDGLMLTTHDSPPGVIAYRGILMRELVRQSVLVAARDELSLPTRDQSLNEPFPREPGGRAPLGVVMTTNAPQSETLACRITVFRSDGGKAVRLWEEDLLGLGTEFRLLEVAREAEALSREAFPAVLREAGFVGRANAWVPDGSVDEEVTAQLQVPNVIAQYAVIRSMHAAIRESGESPGRLSALARAYGNLSSLSDGHWSSATKVHAARALLYAERLVARTDSSADSLYTKAWVLAVIGLHTPALESLDAAADVDEAAPPEWAALVSAYCRGDDVLVTLGDGERWGPWARWLRLLATQGTGATDEVLARAKSVLTATPDCFAAADYAIDFAPSLGVLAEMTSRVSVAFREQGYSRLRRVPRLPESIARLVEEAEESERSGDLAPRGSLVGAAIAAAVEDRVEPSLAVLGNLVGELSLVHALRLESYLDDYLGVDATEQYERILPSIVDHRLVAFASALYADDRTVAQGHFRKAGALVDPLEARWRRLHWFQTAASTRPAADRLAIRDSAFAHLDGVFGDLVAVAPQLTADQLTGVAEAMLRTCPDMPATRSLAIRGSWEKARERLPDWERDSADDPLALAALAQVLVAQDRLTPAARILQRKVEIAPTHQDYRLMARILDRAGDTRLWLVAMKSSLEYPGSGLDHTKVNDDIARHYVKWKDYETALPYAEAAGASWAAWAMGTARDVHQGLGNWERAEEYQKRTSTRYDNQAIKYLYWCLETGHGDLEAAIELARDGRKTLTPSDLGLMALLESDFEEAFRQYSAGYHDRKHPAYGLLAALLADEIGDEATRDRLLRMVETGRSSVMNEHRLAMRAFAKLLRDDFATEPEADIDLEEFERVVAEAPPYAPTQLWLLCGAYLSAHGREEKSREYLQLAATSPQTDRQWRLLARVSLRIGGVEPQAMRAREQRKPPAPAERPGATLMNEHASGGMGIAISEDGRLAASCDQGGEFIVWRIPDAEVVSRFRDPVAPAGYFGFSPDGKWLAASTVESNVVTIWDVERGEIVERLWGHRTVAMTPAFSPDGSLLAVPYSRKDVLDGNAADVTLWNTTTFEEVARLPTGNSVGGGATFTSDGRFLATLTFGRDVPCHLRIFDVETKEQVASLPGERGGLLAVGFSLDRQWAAAAFRTGQFVLWNVDERRIAAEFRDAVHAHSVAVGPAGRLVTYGCPDGTVRVWDVERGRVSLVFTESGGPWTPRVAIGPEGRRVAASMYGDTTDWLWDLENPETRARTPERELGRSLEVFENSIGMSFVHAPAGTFLMGTPDTYSPPPAYTMREWLYSKPSHEVEITRPFLIGRHTVTVEQFRRFVDETGFETTAERKGAGRHITVTTKGYQPVARLSWRSPGFDQKDDRPAVLIDHGDAVAFCEWLSRKEGRTYRLPTEAEWEYACRAGTTTSYSFYNGVLGYQKINASDRSLAAAYAGQRYQTGGWNDGFAFTAPVGHYPPNDWGLFNVHGNVWEWCSDKYDKAYYAKSPRRDPQGPESGKGHVQRGGSFFWHTVNCRSASRGYDVQPSSDSGFRVVLEPETP